MELISIIIPVYNTSAYLEKCVNSFLKQTYQNIEVLLIDDGSTDDSPSLCDKLMHIDSRVRVIHKKNGGLSDARNIGIEKAKGQLIMFYDSDDFVDYDYVNYLYSLKNKYKTQVSVCAYNVVNEDGNTLYSVSGASENAITKEEFFKRMLNEEGITVSACFKLFDKELFRNVRFPIGKLCEDNGTTYKIIENAHGKIAYGNIAKCYYVIRAGSIMRSSFSLRKMDMIELTDQMCDYLDMHYDNLKDLILRRRIYSRFNVLRQMNYKEKSTKKQMNLIIKYIKSYKKFIITNKNVPSRDKIACILLCINKVLFFKSWDIYRVLRYDK